MFFQKYYCPIVHCHTELVVWFLKEYSQYMYQGRQITERRTQAGDIHDIAGPKLGAYIKDLKSSPKKLISCKMTLRRVILSMYYISYFSGYHKLNAKSSRQMSLLCREQKLSVTLGPAILFLTINHYLLLTYENQNKTKWNLTDD